MCRCINAVDLLIDNDFYSFIECWVNFSKKWGPIPGWSVDLKIDWPTESGFPKFMGPIQNKNYCMLRRFLLKCWFTILTNIDRENNSKFNQCVCHIFVDMLIYHPAQHLPRKELKFLPVCVSNPCWYVDYPVPVQWPKNWKIRYSAQIPVDLLIYQNDHLCPRKFSIFNAMCASFPCWFVDEKMKQAEEK